MAMDKRLRAKWVKALRSGKYQQATTQLRRGKSGGYSYCCLGVLCTVAKVPLTADGLECLAPNGDALSYKPIAALIGGTEYRPLMGMNDNGASFAQIADHIEANL